jgi:hypothetical protein
LVIIALAHRARGIMEITRPEDKATLKSDLSAEAGADGLGRGLGSASLRSIQRPECDKLQGVRGTESPVATTPKTHEAF